MANDNRNIVILKRFVLIGYPTTEILATGAKWTNSQSSFTFMFGKLQEQKSTHMGGT